MKELIGQLKKHFPSVSFGYFGSLRDGRAVYGKADVDGFLIMPGGMVSDKRVVKGLSQILARAFSNNPIETQFNLLDSETIDDGRFMSYTKDYSDYFLDNSEILSGPFSGIKMNGYDFRSGVLHSASFNFTGPGGVRNTALYSLNLLQGDYDVFATRVQNAVDKVAKFPNKLIWLRTGKTVPERREAQRIIERNLPEVDYELLDDINDVLDDVRKLDRRLENPESALNLLYGGLELMEQMVLAYVTRYPKIGKREVKI